MKSNTLFFYMALAAEMAFLLSAGCGRDIGGATTETTNGVAGVIRNSDNTAAPNIIVNLFPVDYNPVAKNPADRYFTDTTDMNGDYTFKRVAAGQYNVLARNSSEQTSFMEEKVLVNGSSITQVAAGTLGHSGSVIVDLSSGTTISTGSYLFIPGTDIAAFIGSDGPALLTDVPPGEISTVILATDTNEQRNILRGSINIAAGDTAVIEQPLWKYHCSFILNTTSSGAGVTSDVYHFPVLLRLNSSFFDFSQVKPDGSDLIFTDSNNTPLPATIERWNAAAGLAEIWVKVDTIRGNDSVQSINMFWGNSDFTSQKPVGDVFDTSDGYQGVWHLGEDANDSAGDATINRYNGGSPDTALPGVTEGVIGNCRSFDGTKDFITMPNTAAGKLNFPESGQYTVSAWVRLDTFDNLSHCIVSKGYEQYYLRSTYISRQIVSLTTPSWEFVEFGESAKWQPSTCVAAENEWTYLVCVRQGERQLLYCNGQLADSTVDAWWNDVSRNNGNDLTIGRFAKPVTVPINEGYCYFKGKIDEVRLINKVPDPDWIRLSYMNQRTGDKLVIFRGSD